MQNEEETSESSSDIEYEHSASGSESLEDRSDWDNAFANEKRIEKQLENIRNGVM